MCTCCQLACCTGPRALVSRFPQSDLGVVALATRTLELQQHVCWGHLTLHQYIAIPRTARLLVTFAHAQTLYYASIQSPQDITHIWCHICWSVASPETGQTVLVWQEHGATNQDVWPAGTLGRCRILHRRAGRCTSRLIKPVSP